jgi:hypothetical protein
MYSTYARLGLHVSASSREVIKAARSLIAKKLRRNPQWRPERKGFYREMLDHHLNAQRLYRAVQTGDFA